MSIIKTHTRLLGCLLVLMVSNAGFGQEEIVKLKGTVRSFNNDVSNVLVVNLNTKKATITGAEGLFSLEVKLRDTIQFSAIQYITKVIIMTDTILHRNTLLVNLVEKVIKLDEVTVMPYDLTGKIDLDVSRLGIKQVVTSSSLGLPNANVEMMTQSERLLFEADRGEFTSGGVHLDTLFLFPIVGVHLNINLHKTLNFISGRTKTLKDAVSREENVKMENKIISMFSKTTISEAFGIPQNNIDGFLNFCLAQKDFSKLSEAKNSIQIWKYLKDKSNEYKETNNLSQLVKTH